MTWVLVLELLAKSSVIAGAGLGLSALLAFRPASERVDVLRAAVCLLILVPLVVLVGPRLPLAWLAPVETVAVETVSLAAPTVEAFTVNLRPVAEASVIASLPNLPFWSITLAAVYGTGLLLLLGRFAAGLWTLHRWTAAGRVVKDRNWTQALERLDGSGRTRLVASPRIEAPLSWGLPPGVVLIGEDTLRRSDTAPAVLAHELAHVRRGDWLFMALSRLAVALFWFNPVVWLLHHQLSARTEDAADAAAVAQVDRKIYARALVDFASDFTQPAALGMAGSRNALARRIACIMKTPRKSPSRPVAMALAVGALVAVATPLAAVELLPRPPAPPAPPRISAPFAPLAPIAPPVPPQASAVQAPPAPPAPPEPPTGAFRDRYVITNNGQTRTYMSLDEMDPETRREFERAHDEAERARGHAEEARRAAERIRTSIDHAAIDRAREAGLRAGAEARAHAETARREAERVRASIDHEAIARAREQGQRAAESARAHAEVARREARAAMVQARAGMRTGADQMDRGAEQMREEARKLRDPAYRARQIEENRARGHEVTDRELIDLSRRLPEQAADMERQAQRMREQASRDI